MTLRILKASVLGIALLLAFDAETLRAEEYVIQEVMSGLVTPRGLAFGPDGSLYVAEAGSGGSGPSIVLGNGNTGFFGATGGLSRLLGGVQTRVHIGLPSVATAAGLDAGGLQDIYGGNYPSDHFPVMATFRVVPVPEPAMLTLLASALVMIVGIRVVRGRRATRLRALSFPRQIAAGRISSKRWTIAIVVAALFAPAPVRGEQVFDWVEATELHPGVLWHHVDTNTPRNLAINVLRIDTLAPGVKFYTTPRIDDGWVANDRETAKQTTRDFLRQSRADGRLLVAAVNGDVWTPFPASDETPANLRGLAISDAVVVSPARGTTSLLISDTGSVSIASTTAQTELSHVQTAVSGFGYALREGVPISSGLALHPRTGFGISADSRFLFLLTIDGRRWSSQGGTENDVGQWLLYCGAHTGVNMDGGGSTTMAWWNPNLDDAQLLNVPNSNDLVNLQDPEWSMQTENLYFQNGLLPNERAVGNNFGVYFVTVPEPATLTLLGSALLMVVGSAIRRGDVRN